MTEKAASGLLVGLFVYIVGQINFVTVSLLIFMCIDFLTGVLGARSTGEKITKEKLTLGAIKKTGILILWFVSVIIQLVVMSEGSKIGITLTTPYINLVMTFYLLGSETICISKNLSEMGVKSPRWLHVLASNMKKEKL